LDVTFILLDVANVYVLELIENYRYIWWSIATVKYMARCHVYIQFQSKYSIKLNFRGTHRSSKGFFQYRTCDTMFVVEKKTLHLWILKYLYL